MVHRKKNFKNHKRKLKFFSFTYQILNVKFFEFLETLIFSLKWIAVIFEFISSVFFFNKSLKDDVVDGMRTPIDSVMSNLMARLRWLITGMRHLPVISHKRIFWILDFMVLHLVKSLSTDGIIL